MHSAISPSLVIGQIRTADRVQSPQPKSATPAQPTGSASDSELILRMGQREEAALAAIYDRYSGLVYAIGLRIVGDREVAEEVVQDVFQAAWQSAASFRPEGSLAAWLAGITRHRAIDATRSRSFRARAREDLLNDEWLGNAASNANSHTESLLLRSVIRAALLQLPTDQRNTIELAYYGGLTQAEIADRLGEPIGTIKSRMRMGLIKLRDLLAEVQ